jgi:uncharacterized protein with PIN domain
MIAADTSTWIAYLQGDPGKDAQMLDQALTDRQVLMIPVVLTELLRAFPPRWRKRWLKFP